ncbi:MAG: hypothetical protein ACK5U8_16640 [Deltaproteobacteria bacterium]
MSNSRPLVALALVAASSALGAPGCGEDASGSVVQMNADAVVVRVTASPGLWVYTAGATAVQVPPSGSVDLRVPLSQIHEYGGRPATLGVSVQRLDGGWTEYVSQFNVVCPRTVAAASQGGAQVTWALAEGPDTVAVEGDLGAGQGRFVDGMFELPFRGDPGTTLTVADTRETAAADAAGSGALRLWLPPRLASLSPDLNANFAPVTLSLAVGAPGRETRNVQVRLNAPAGRILRATAPFAAAQRPLWSAAPPTATPRGRSALVVEVDRDAVRRTPVGEGTFAECDVLVVTALENEQVLPCAYSSPSPTAVNLSSADVLAVAYDTRTGAEIGRRSVAAERRGCPATVSLAPDEQMRERPPIDAVDAAVRSLAGI